MNFKVDENLPVEIAAMLRAEGHDAATIAEQELQGEADPSLARICIREGRILVSLDQGFGDLRRYPPEDYPGFIVLRVHNQDKPTILELFQRLLPKLVEEPIKNCLWIVEDSRIRIRSADKS